MSNIPIDGFSTDKLTYNWSIQINGEDGNPGFDLKSGTLFFFALFKCGETQPYAQSQNISITTPATSSTSSSTSSNPTTTLSTSIAHSTSSPSPSASPVTPGGLSSSAKTGLGVGLGVGIMAVAIGLAIGYFLFGRKKPIVGGTQLRELEDHKAMGAALMSLQPHEAPENTHPVHQGIGTRIHEIWRQKSVDLCGLAFW